MHKKASKQRKCRNAEILFARNTPFKNKIVRLKTAYSRKIKHKGRDQ